MELQHKGISYDLDVVHINRGHSVVLEVQTENANKQFTVSISGDLSEEELDELAYGDTIELLPNYAGGYMEEINEWVFNTEVAFSVSDIIKRALSEKEDSKGTLKIKINIGDDINIEVAKKTKGSLLNNVFNADSYEEIYNKLYN